MWFAWAMYSNLEKWHWKEYFFLLSLCFSERILKCQRIPAFGVSCLSFCTVWKMPASPQFRHFVSWISVQFGKRVSAFHVRVSVQFGKEVPVFAISYLSFCAVWKTRSRFRHFISEFLCSFEIASEPTVTAFCVWVSVQFGKGLVFGISCLNFCVVWKRRSGFRYFMSEFLCSREKKVWFSVFRI